MADNDNKGTVLTLTELAEIARTKVEFPETKIFGIRREGIEIALSTDEVVDQIYLLFKDVYGNFPREKFSDLETWKVLIEKINAKNQQQQETEEEFNSKSLDAALLKNLEETAQEYQSKAQADGENITLQEARKAVWDALKKKAQEIPIAEPAVFVSETGEAVPETAKPENLTPRFTAEIPTIPSSHPASIPTKISEPQPAPAPGQPEGYSPSFTPPVIFSSPRRVQDSGPEEGAKAAETSPVGSKTAAQEALVRISERAYARNTNLIKEPDKYLHEQFTYLGSYLKEIAAYKPDIVYFWEIETVPITFEQSFIEQADVVTQFRIQTVNSQAPVAKGYFGRATQLVGQQVKGKVQNAASAAAVKTLKTATGLASKAAPPLAAAQAATGLFGKLTGFVTGLFKKIAPDIFSKAQVSAKKNLDWDTVLSTAGGIIGIFLGGPAGAVAGALLGLIAGKIIGFFRDGGGRKDNFGDQMVSDVTGGVKKTGVFALLFGSLMGSGLLIAFCALGGVLIYLGFHNLQVKQAMLSRPEAIDTGGPVPIFEITKSADPTSLSNFDSTSGDKTINYSVKIIPKDTKIIVSDLNEKTKDFKKGGGCTVVVPDLLLPSGQPVKNSLPITITPEEPLILHSSLTIPAKVGLDCNDSNLVNTVTAIGAKDIDPGNTQSQSAEAVVRIGNPKDDPPYGFPVAGPIFSLDDLPPHSDGSPHCGGLMLDSGSGTCVTGGIDIDRVTDVVSTLNGEVIYSAFLDGTYGGVVYVASDTREYKVAFIHLAKTGLISVGQRVERGKTVIGQVYNDYAMHSLLYSSGPHVHYQVLRFGVNVNFTKGVDATSGKDAGGQTVAGKCSEGAIEPVPPPSVYPPDGTEPVPAAPPPTTCD